MNEKRPLYLMIGPSGAGKHAIVDRLCKIMRLTKVRSYTTRPYRAIETLREGDPEDAYYFVTDNYFDTLTKPPCGICAVTTYDGYRYGTARDEIDAGDLFIVDPAGAEAMEQESLARPLYEIYVNVPKYTRVKRMLIRGDSAEEIKWRMEYEDDVFSEFWWSHFAWEYFIPIQCNYGLADAVAEIAEIIARNWPEEQAAKGATGEQNSNSDSNSA